MSDASQATGFKPSVRTVFLVFATLAALSVSSFLIGGVNILRAIIASWVEAEATVLSAIDAAAIAFPLGLGLALAAYATWTWGEKNL